jgi:hypothetical protein
MKLTRIVLVQGACGESDVQEKRLKIPMNKKRNVHPATLPVSTVQTVSPPSQGVPERPPHAEICQRAYFIWLSKGRPSDQDVTNWLEAEAQLCGKVQVRPTDGSHVA